MKHKLMFLLAFAGLIFAPGCGTLAPEGVYRGDKTLYTAELAITTSYDLLHTFVKWEHENRAALAGMPEIKRAADDIRAHAKQWFASAHALHDAYKLDPSQENKDNLQLTLSVIRAALLQATAHMTAAAVEDNRPTK